MSPTLDIIDDLGNQLVEKTLASAASCNFKGIIAAANGNAIDYASAYAEFITSSAIEGTMYLSYLINLNALTTSCIDNSNRLLEFKNRVGAQIDKNGLSYENAMKYDDIVRDCISTIKATEEYAISQSYFLRGIYNIAK